MKYSQRDQIEIPNLAWHQVNSGKAGDKRMVNVVPCDEGRRTIVSRTSQAQGFLYYSLYFTAKQFVQRIFRYSRKVFKLDFSLYFT